MTIPPSRGTLYGLGIGPGDPELITVKAREILAHVPVIAYPAPEGGESLVRRIAAVNVPEGRIEIAIVTPMAIERFPAQEVYDRYAVILTEHLAAGRDVAVLCEGDPFLYGSFMYLYERLAPTHPAVVVPGVSSLGAVAAAAGRPLCSRNDIFTVLPAPLSEAELEARLRTADAVAIMKVGRHLPKVRRVLQRLGLEADASYVARATMAEQQIVPLTDLTRDGAPYFSTILVKTNRHRQEDRADIQLPPGAAIIALSATGAVLARRLQAILPESQVHGLTGRTEGTDVTFSQTTTHLKGLFATGVPIVGVCAAGILIRAVAPQLTDKRREPPVIAVAEDGQTAVPLLGGHHGANRLARAIAAELGGQAAITTAGDIRLGIGLDDPPAGWSVANPEAAKALTAALLAGEPVRLEVDAGDAGWLTETAIPFTSAGKRAIRITDRTDPGDEDTLLLHPPVLAIGIGCERGAAAEDVIALVEKTLATHELAKGAVACLASIDVKMDEPAVHAAAASLGVPVRFFTAAELEAETPRLASPSEIVFRAVGCHGVAEAAALAIAGDAATLVVSKQRSERATCAVARAPGAIDPGAKGRVPGTLTVVGIGPGADDWRTPEVSRAVSAATDVVGYQLYLDLIEPLTAGKRLHAPPMTAEEARARLALDLAAEGRRVVLVCSGDAGVYALASLVFELIEREDDANWRRIRLAVAPGLSAMFAAAARAGAPLGHDFCTVSLSDLLTPWPDIERRLQAAAVGDFVVALYNPVSQRRRSQLPAARDILLQHRPAATPVVLARNLGRDGETIRVITLGQLDADQVDMLTLVLIGSSQTRILDRGDRRWVYTPRGYATKQARKEAEA
ncbi:precorrin-3B C(17)-methyltransferase [Defluviicoccus vanus]|uniref:precorrin-3B C(17)-methyltransferase n=1 Tax=Defluviicoccus vanus TaxID=111831 RepID=UPI001CBA5F2E|nr:precorrin-3B C(17)-methyltransferase [Defluviicoccus vanus]